MLILDFQELMEAMISEVLVHLLKQEVQEEMKRKSKRKVANQSKDLDSQEN
jgi:hypothetical protein